MIYVFCDVGVKNYCYLVVSFVDGILSFINFDIVILSVDSIIEDVLDIMEELTDKYTVSKFFIELQNYRNTRCVKIETVMATYLTLKNIPFKRVQAQVKLRKLNITTTSYTVRKREAIRIGEEQLALYESLITERIATLKKKDDIYDCILMAVTELIH